MSGAYLVRLSRPRFWLYLAGPVLVGAAWGVGSLDQLAAWRPWALFAFCLLPANVFLYGVNDRFDADIDQVNPKKDDKEARWQGGRGVWASILAALAAGLALTAALPRGAWPWMLGFGALSVAYSAPPVRFKARPFLDSASNGLYVLPGAAAYVTVSGHQPDAWLMAGAWAWTMAMHTFSAIPDIEPDRRAGVRTTATVLGRRGTVGYCLGMWAVAAGLVSLASVPAAAVFAIYPVVLVAIEISGVPLGRAYWAYPWINAAAGAALTIGGLLATGDPGVWL
jgi:4-hydroxybenzoate polyprenyltransferase